MYCFHDLLVDVGTLNNLLSEGEELLRAMQQEVRMAPPGVRPEMDSRLGAQRREWNNFERSSRSQLLMTSSPSGPSRPGTSARLEDNLAQGTAILEKTSQSIMRATQVAQESEAIGSEVVSELGVQRENLVRTRDRITDANQDLKKSHVVIRSINRRLLTNKFLLIVIIIMELAILLALVYLKFIKKKT